MTAAVTVGWCYAAAALANGATLAAHRNDGHSDGGAAVRWRGGVGRGGQCFGCRVTRTFWCVDACTLP